jgi:hypothetical protein
LYENDETDSKEIKLISYNMPINPNLAFLIKATLVKFQESDFENWFEQEFGETGYISLEALKWLALEKIQVDVFKWDDSLISSFNKNSSGDNKRETGRRKTFYLYPVS